MQIKRIDLDLIYIAVGKRYNKNPDKVKQIMEHFFKTIRQYTEMPLFPRIFVTGLFKLDVNTKELILKRVNTVKNHKLGNLGSEYPEQLTAQVNTVLDEVLKDRLYPKYLRQYEHRNRE